MTNKYSFWKGLSKSVMQLIVFGAPFVLQALPQDWMNLTLGSLLALTLNYIKVKAKSAGYLS